MIVNGRQIDEALNLDSDNDPFTVADLIKWAKQRERERCLQIMYNIERSNLILAIGAAICETAQE